MSTTRDNWTLIRTGYDPDTHNHFAPVYTVGNGFICCRGFMEEQRDGVGGLGGIYMAGVFGRASYKPWKGEGQELVNLPNLFRADITLDGKPLEISPERLGDYTETFSLGEALLTRQYTYICEGEPLAQLEFQRFCSWADIHLAGQRVRVKPLKPGVDIRVLLSMDGNVSNLNELSSEPHPLQPGKKHWETIGQEGDSLRVRLDDPAGTELIFVQQVTETAPLTFEKLISLNEESIPEDSFEEVLAAHRAAVAEFWATADVEIEGDGEAQTALRYNILQLEQSRPRHTNKVSIGARGLTGEMYEGSVFWDTEIFMLPFFTMTNPKAARDLLMFRYHTLPEAREHARSNWFDGAMYGWQVNAQGVEQTPQGVGAYYSIHIVADVAFAILEYWNATGDEGFLLDYGLEILIETARFWQSRVTVRGDGYYDILAVRGPNEYDVLVNNNLYTNMMARENFLLCEGILGIFSEKYPERLAELTGRLGFSDAEKKEWQDISEKLLLPYDAEKDLWLEDDTWLRRKAVDMSKAKPTAKRIIDTAIPYEALPLYQITKQADVLHVMKNLPWRFTPEQIQKAFDYYLPKTAFDSSLAYSMFALMAARLGLAEDALSFFNSCANLDIRNVQLNTISGLHFANFGGTWQAAVFGFGGVSVWKDRLDIRPSLPSGWQRMSFHLRYHGTLLAVEINREEVCVTVTEAGKPVSLQVSGEHFTLKAAADKVRVKL